MSNKLILRDVTIRGELDQDNELEMDFYTGHAWIYRAEAKNVVDHLTEVFGPENDKDAEIERLRAEVTDLQCQLNDLYALSGRP